MKRPVFRLQSLRSIAIVFVNVLLFDQGSKLWVERSMDINQSFHPISALSGVFSITYVTNTGVPFGFFKEPLTFVIFLVLIVISLLLYLFVRMDLNPRVARIGLALAVSGAISNLIDHARLGYAINFLDFKFWPIVNLADLAIVSGIVLLLISAWIDWQPEGVATRAPDA